MNSNKIQYHKLSAINLFFDMLFDACNIADSIGLFACSRLKCDDFATIFTTDKVFLIIRFHRTEKKVLAKPS